VSAQTAYAHAKKLRDLLKIGLFDLKWTLPSQLDDSPMAWMFEVDGFIVGIRSQPLEIQEKAFAKGLIPYVPALRDAAVGSQSSTSSVRPGRIPRSEKGDGEAHQGQAGETGSGQERNGLGHGRIQEGRKPRAILKERNQSGMVPHQSFTWLGQGGRSVTPAPSPWILREGLRAFRRALAEG
jgi:hypothetical protein